MERIPKKCFCCRRESQSYRFINDDVYCGPCFVERAEELAVAGVELRDEGELKFTTEVGTIVDSEVRMYGHFRLVDDGRSMDPQFEYQIHGKGPVFGCTFHSIPEDSRIWLAQIMRRQLFKAYELGQDTKQQEMRDALSSMSGALGVKMPWQR